jgi:D-alanyl-D-alanine carboxypeptidase
MKTGVTNNAGPCLCTSIVASDKYPTPLIIVLVNSQSMDIRWMETWKLAKWAA